jgi:hypothetical protein
LGGGVSFGALLLELLVQARPSATVNNRTVEKIRILLATDEKITILRAAYLMSLPPLWSTTLYRVWVERAGKVSKFEVGNLNKLSH